MTLQVGHIREEENNGKPNKKERNDYGTMRRRSEIMRSQRVISGNSVLV